MSEGPSQFKPKIDAANEKVSTSLAEAIVAVKEVIATKNRLYSVDMENLDFEALKELEGDYIRVADMASKALSMRAQVKFANSLDKSMVKIDQSRQLSEKLNSSGSLEEKESIMSEIDSMLNTM